MRYIVIGAGAVGGAIGGRLAQAGHEVVLVARGAHHTALREHGLRLITPDGPHTRRLPTVDGPAALGGLRPDDVLLLSVKTQDTESALAVWGPAPVTGGGTATERLPLVCAQNGVEGQRLALRRFHRVYGVCVWLPAGFVEPGVVSAAGTPLTGMLHLGRYPHGTDETAHRIAADLERSRFEAPVVPDVQRWQYAKLLANLANALEAVSGPVVGEAAEGLYVRVRAEGERVLDAAGIAYASAEEQRRTRGDKITLVPLDGAPRGGGSSWQSLTRGTGTIEADHLNGEIALLGRLHGVPTPLNDLLRRLANTFAREHRAAGSLPVAELTRLADDAVAFVQER
ncbi:ketopantoate reductase family protein [Streptomyces europaeiscabiei]|uniref:ketopantoate reductase family protein n=1 Tax=Streptomyces europaeiscabiei TaxID=146819 RepID=UPI0029BBB00D|nr:2-dehydropantoate 2-reductase N-terminal domain-containing protein [Streptomyces europaeiscabiei]MDX3842033.1 2-dehydropantoate 2-reductase N-terminal domain-containing protein [Streptomyces europaeiscabiei]MDX3859751.1 2-dehydropantoate 2-reductase N-terminal domain-containing protein [Streptomyces europaeiscabiei]MDX3873840.1 2-dehydropantoate 2-reductase N-terminal domain-containing protein [Streptomyces europaeiscabiei]